MKKKIVLLSEQTKKHQRQFYEKQRGSWDGVNPVTRILPDKKAYDRRREKRAERMSAIL